ncbi:MAG: MarR family transcriptional regulator [Armatimonadetes bacterium]|nr:MarR family transcriptional regulator [Armatimonadota bacterium]
MMPDDTNAYAGQLADLFTRVAAEVLGGEVLRRVSDGILTPALLSVLECVHRRGTCGVGEVACYLGISSAAASQLARRLEDGGLLARGEDARDRRRSPLRVTASGERLVRAAARVRAERLESILSRMEAASRRAFVRGVEAFLAHAIEEADTIERLCGRCRIPHSDECVVSRVAVLLTGEDVSREKRS